MEDQKQQLVDNTNNNKIDKVQSQKKSNFIKRRWKLILIIVVIAFAIAGGVVAFFKLQSKDGETELTYDEKVANTTKEVGMTDDDDKTLQDLINLRAEAETEEDKQKLDDSIARQYSNTGDYKKSIEYRLKIVENTEDPIEKAYGYGELADLYSLDGQKDKALESIDKGLAVLETVKDADGYSNVKAELEGRKTWINQ